MFCCCLDASVVHAFGTGQLQANPSVPGPRLSPCKSTLRAEYTIGTSDLVVGEDDLLDRVVSGIADKRACDVHWPLAAHIGEDVIGEDFKPPMFCVSCPLWKRLQEIISRKIRS